MLTKLNGLLGRIIITIGIGLILLAGYFYTQRMNDNPAVSDTNPTTAETVVSNNVQEEETTTTATTDLANLPTTNQNIAGINMQVKSDIQNRQILVSEIIPTPTPIVVPEEVVPVEEQPVQAEIIPPTAEPVAPPQPTPVPVQPTALPTNPPPVNSIHRSDVETIRYVDHTIVANDTLYEFTRKYPNTSLELLYRAGFTEDQYLTIGDVVKIPIPNEAHCSGAAPYIVKDTDTVYSISRDWNTTIEKIQQVNGLDANFFIKAGWILCRP